MVAPLPVARPKATPILHPMKLPLRLILLLLLCPWPVAHQAQGQVQQSRGDWKPPPANGKPWKHETTGLSFPQQLGGYRLAGEFSYHETGVFIRYENLEERARCDIFFFPTDTTPKLEDRHRLILREMEAVISDFQQMARDGRYKNVQIDPVTGSEIALWQKESLPIATRAITATRIGRSDQGVEEAVIKQWIGITHLNNYLLTIRHLRPADTGEAGDANMKKFVGLVLQVIKDPPLRADVRRLVDVYLAEPLSDAGVEAASMVLTYLNQTPFFAVSLPEEPISSWLQQCKAAADGTEAHLLRAFMVGSAKAALDGADAATILEAGCRQFARIYRELLPKQPQIANREMDQFAAAAEKGQGATWLRNHMTKKRS